MKIHELAEKCEWRLLAGEKGKDRDINGCYAGDLLSWVMGRAREDNVWLTVMGNVNAVAVATLTDCCGIVLTEGAALDADAKARAEQQGVAIYSTAENTYDTAVKISGII